MPRWYSILASGLNPTGDLGITYQPRFGRPYDSRRLESALGPHYPSLPLSGLDAFNVINATFSGNTLLSRNTAIDGTGTYRNGTAYQTFSSSTGLTIDAQGYEGQPEGSSLTVTNGGTNWSPASGGILSYATDACNGSYSLTTASGVVTAALVLRVSYCPPIQAAKVQFASTGS